MTFGLKVPLFSDSIPSIGPGSNKELELDQEKVFPLGETPM